MSFENHTAHNALSTNKKVILVARTCSAEADGNADANGDQQRLMAKCLR